VQRSESKSLLFIYLFIWESTTSSKRKLSKNSLYKRWNSAFNNEKLKYEVYRVWFFFQVIEGVKFNTVQEFNSIQFGSVQLTTQWDGVRKEKNVRSCQIVNLHSTWWGRGECTVDVLRVVGFRCDSLGLIITCVA
jgi:hypothetical protein